MSLANATVGTSDTTIFTAANAGGVAITAIILTNTEPSETRTVTVNARPLAEAVAAENRILSDLSLDAGDTYVFEGKLILADTDRISAISSGGTAVVATVSYLNL